MRGSFFFELPAETKSFARLCWYVATNMPEKAQRVSYVASKNSLVESYPRYGGNIVEFTQTRWIEQD